MCTFTTELLCLYQPEGRKETRLSIFVLYESFVYVLALLLVEPAKKKAAATSPSLGRDPGSLGIRLGRGRYVEIALGWSSYRRWPQH